jgi:hypothetical protein
MPCRLHKRASAATHFVALHLAALFLEAHDARFAPASG